VAAIELVFACTCYAFHDLGSACVESQCGGQDDTDGELGAVGRGDGVADAFAVKKNIGLGVDGHAIDGLGRHRKRRFVKTESKTKKAKVENGN